jgi:hypothetical protein
MDELAEFKELKNPLVVQKANMERNWQRPSEAKPIGSNSSKTGF